MISCTFYVPFVGGPWDKLTRKVSGEDVYEKGYLDVAVSERTQIRQVDGFSSPFTVTPDFRYLFRVVDNCVFAAGVDIPLGDVLVYLLDSYLKGGPDERDGGTQNR